MSPSELIHRSSRNSVCYSLSFCLWVKIDAPSSLPGILCHSVQPGPLLSPHLSLWSCMKDMLGQYRVQCVLPILTCCGLEFLCSKGSRASWKRENWNMSWLLAPGLSDSPGSQASYWAAVPGLLGHSLSALSWNWYMHFLLSRTFFFLPLAYRLWLPWNTVPVWAEINEYLYYTLGFQHFRHSVYHSVKFSTGDFLLLFLFLFLIYLPILTAESSRKPYWGCFLEFLKSRPSDWIPRLLKHVGSVHGEMCDRAHQSGEDSKADVNPCRQDRTKFCLECWNARVEFVL